MKLKYPHVRENQPGVSMSSCTTWEKLIKSVAEQAFCEFILCLPWGTVKYISSTNQNNHLELFCSLNPVMFDAPAYHQVCLVWFFTSKKASVCSKTARFPLKPWNQAMITTEMCHTTSLWIIFPSAEHSKLVGLIKSHETHGICKCVNWTIVSVSLCPLWCFSQRRRLFGNPKRKVIWKDLKVNPAYPSGSGSS